MAQAECEESVNEIFSERIIKRAPDKMIDFLDGHILLAYRNCIMYLDVSDYGVVDGKVPNSL